MAPSVMKAAGQEPGPRDAMLFSIVIPTYNRRAFLEEALASALTQTLTDYEIVVVDDGSSDGTCAWLATQSERIRVISRPNGGPGAARNAGAAAAKGRYLVFLDSDDLFFPWTLAVYQQLLARHGNPAFTVGKPLPFVDGHACCDVVPARPSAIVFDDYLASAREWKWCGASASVVDREVFSSIGGFDEQPNNGEDTDLALKMGCAAGFVQVTRPYTFMYRQHDRNLTKMTDRAVSGALRKVDAEKGELYPGGARRARDRRMIITRHVRPIALACLRERRWRAAWGLYFATAAWNARLGRLRFLAGFPVLALYHRLRAVLIG